jgi:hypothetical protein
MDKAGSFLSRRKLLVGAGGVAAVAIAVKESPFGAVVDRTARDIARREPLLRGSMLSLAQAGYEEWTDQVGSIFNVGGGDSLKLVGVAPFESTGARPVGLARDRAFLAKFDVQNGGSMAGDLIYTVVHPQYGAMQVFLSASSDPRLPNRMNAVFN